MSPASHVAGFAAGLAAAILLQRWLGGASDKARESPDLVRLKALADAWVLGGQVPSVTVLITKPRAALFSYSAGPDADDDIHRFWSMTKPIVSCAVMLLVERGLVELDAPISRYLAEFAQHPSVWVSGAPAEMKTEPARRQITVRDLLTHRSGLCNSGFGDTAVDKAYWSKFPPHAKPFWSISNAELLEGVSKLPLHFHPGTRFAYGLGIDVAGCLVERVSSVDLEEFLQRELLKPLGMADTSFFVPPHKLGRVREQHQYGLEFGHTPCDPASIGR